MSSLIILLLAVIAVLGPLNIAKSASAQTLDINKILELVQKQRVNSGANRQSRLQLAPDSSDTSSEADTGSGDETESDESDDPNSNRFGRTNDKLLELIDTLVNENRYKAGGNDNVPYKTGKPKYRQNNNYVSRNQKRDNSQDNAKIRTQNILETLFGDNLNVEDRKTKSKGAYERKKLNPGLLLPRPDDNYNRNDDVNGLDDYSKVYIVMNPKAVRQSRNKNALNDLISKILSLTDSTSKRERSVNSKPRRLKGLVVNDQVIRRSRHSKEIYAPRDDSNGDEYKSKKSRGPAGGHTAIPYIRNRGDIYERN